MSATVKVCEIDPECKEKLRKFRFRKSKSTAAIVLKIQKEKRLIIVDDEYEDCDLEELQNEIPEMQPRFIAYSCKYEHGDGRISYPMCVIYSSPCGCKPELQMLYAGSMKSLVDDVGFTKVFEVRSVEELTDDWLNEQLSETYK